MIVPMKKVSFFVLDSEKKQTLKKLRKLGLLHIEVMQGSGPKLTQLREQITELENASYAVSDRVNKDTVSKDISTEEALSVAGRISSLLEERKAVYAEVSAVKDELERLKGWGEIHPEDLASLAEKGIQISLCEMSPAEYDHMVKALEAEAEANAINTMVLNRSKALVRLLVIQKTVDPEDKIISNFKIRLPEMSTADMRQRISDLQQKLKQIEEELSSYDCYVKSIQKAITSLQKEIEFETYATGMGQEALSEDARNAVAIAYFTGYIPTEDLDALKEAAKENAWGLMTADPTPEDDVPTKLKNNKLVSLIYPLTDFLGTVPGYFEYDISAWFLGFILVFFGIIFGDGGYGLLILGAAGALMLKEYLAGKAVSPTYLLIALMGGATILWGVLTCTWFGMSPEQLPQWLRSISLPVISNVNADKIWYPFWTDKAAGLTTAQNVQIFCFTLALVQLTAAHVKGAIRNRDSLKWLGDLGSILQLLGIYYVVLALVVNSAVFGLNLVISGIPVGMLSIALVGIGFVMSFVFANYEGSVGKSILESLKNIVSVLLGVVNLFSDIVSYIRLWAVGLAGAAISATVNELAGPLFGKFAFIIVGIILLVFGHGLNMILNVLSVIVHGVRLNTLEFSSHLDMSWSGHKFKPFEE